MSNELLREMNDKLGAILNLLAGHVGKEIPPYVRAAEAVLAEVPAPNPVPAPVESDEEDSLKVGARVVYSGTRTDTMPDCEGTVVEVKERGWILVTFDGEGEARNCRYTELTLASRQAPALTEEEEAKVEEHEAEQEEAGPTIRASGDGMQMDQEAAGYKIPTGAWSEYRDIHAIYTDPKKMDYNRRFLRLRAKKVFKDDVTTKEMCHRYLVSVQDEVYLDEVSA